MGKYYSKAHAKYDQEATKQYYIVYGAVVIALQAGYDFRNKRIKKIFNEADSIWEHMDVEQKIIGVVRLLDRETGIALSMNGKPYKDIDVFQDGYFDTVTTQPRVDYCYEVLKDWAAYGYLAAILIALHRKERWGNRKRLPDFLELIDWTRSDHRDIDEYIRILREQYQIEYR